MITASHISEAAALRVAIAELRAMVEAYLANRGR